MGTDIAKQAIVVLVLVLSAASVSFGKYGGGTGEPNDPYRIATANDLNDIGNHVEDFNKCFVMVNDINLAGYTGTQFNIIGSDSNAFTGVFDGNGHRICNFTYECAVANYIGLFGYIYHPNAVVRNLSLIDPNVDVGTGYYIGAVVGRLRTGTMSNCAVESGNVSGEWYVGGLVGDSYRDSIISNCHATAVVSGFRDTGGLAGGNQLRSVISDCYAAGRVSGTGNQVGGLVGWNGGTVLDCYVTGNVSGNNDYVGGLIGQNYFGTVSNCYAEVILEADGLAGGLAGTNSGPISYCYSTGSVSGTGYYVGGLVGHNSDACDLMGVPATISNCYSTASASGDFKVGGLIGDTYSATIVNCYAVGSVSGTGDVGGLVGVDGQGSYAKCFWDETVNSGLDGIGNKTDPNVIGKTTAEMQTESTFTDAGWDFVEVWGIGDNQTYPFLRVHSAGDLNHDDKVNWLDLAILAGHWLEGT
ncbi:MAG: GLUG motif-containing protein [Planctomycetota bacterium]